jgi:hypothetical protein
MFHSGWLLRRLSLVVLFVIPALACEFSVSTAKISDAVMAANTQGDNFEPVGVTDTYATDQAVFHAVVSVANAPSDTRVKAVWTAIDVGEAAPPDSVVDQTEISVEGSRNIDFALASDSGQWPPGTYKVDVYLNDELDRTLSFSVAE